MSYQVIQKDEFDLYKNNWATAVQTAPFGFLLPAYFQIEGRANA